MIKKITPAPTVEPVVIMLKNGAEYIGVAAMNRCAISARKLNELLTMATEDPDGAYFLSHNFVTINRRIRIALDEVSTVRDDYKQRGIWRQDA